MRKILTIAMIFGFLLSLCACGSSVPPSEAQDNGGHGENPAGSPNTNAEGLNIDKKINASPGDEVFDAKAIRIIYKGFEEETNLGPWFLFDIENNGEDGITVQTSDVLINGLIENPPISTNVEPGKIKDAAQTVLYSTLEENNIAVSEIENISLKFTVFKTSTWEMICESDDVMVKP